MYFICPPHHCNGQMSCSQCTASCELCFNLCEFIVWGCIFILFVVVFIWEASCSLDFYPIIGVSNYLSAGGIVFHEHRSTYTGRNRRMFYIAICDDEKYFRIRERELIAKYMDRKSYKFTIDIYDSGIELLKEKSKIPQYDIIFLDINMKEIDGIKTAREIRKITREVYIVFVTAFITYAPEGYEVDAVRYLLKDDERIEKAMAECLETVTHKLNDIEHKHTFEFREGKVTVFFEDILYVESNLHKLIFHMAGNLDRKYTMYEKLDSIEELLHDAGFCRIHKSCLVNLRYVEHVERYKAGLQNGSSLAISKSRYIHTRDEWICYRGEI